MISVYHKFCDPRGNDYIIRDIDPPIDAISYYNYISDKDTTSKLDIPPYTCLDKARRDIYRFSKFTADEGKCFAVAICKTNELIGTIGYNYISRYRGELVVDLNPDYRRLGIMETAFKWLELYAKGRDIRTLSVTTHIDNKILINALKRFDFKAEAINLCGKLVYNKQL
jgi:RimJ/RimL family protein N-acetyltransferase